MSSFRPLSGFELWIKFVKGYVILAFAGISFLTIGVLAGWQQGELFFWGLAVVGALMVGVFFWGLPVVSKRVDAAKRAQKNAPLEAEVLSVEVRNVSKGSVDRSRSRSRNQRVRHHGRHASRQNSPRVDVLDIQFKASTGEVFRTTAVPHRLKADYEPGAVIEVYKDPESSFFWLPRDLFHGYV